MMVTGNMEGMVERRIPITLLLSATPGKSGLTYCPLTASFPRKNWCISMGFFLFFPFGEHGLPFHPLFRPKGNRACILVIPWRLVASAAPTVDHGTVLVCGCLCVCVRACLLFRKGNLTLRSGITLNSGFHAALHNRRDKFLGKGLKQ